jgi:hypothetical protein
MTGRLTPQDIVNLNTITKFSASLGFIGVCSMGYVREFDLDDLSKSLSVSESDRSFDFGNDLYGRV